jgi:AAHS family benzoate transporter-like MFS transporter
MKVNRAANSKRLESSPDGLVGRPGWLRLTPHVTHTPSLTDREWSVLAVIALISIFNRYNVALLATTIKQVQDDLGIPESQVGALTAIVHVGAVPALALFLAADRVGRRRLMLISFVGYSVVTPLGALATNAAAFVLTQFVARMFIVTGLILAAVIITEEFNPKQRGWGVGTFGAISAYGFAVVLLLFGVIDRLPGGWRFLYAFSLVPLAFLPLISRALPNTRRFEQHITRRDTTLSGDSPLKPLISLYRMYPRRIVAACTVLFLVNYGSQASSFFYPKYLQDAHGWTPGRVALITFVGGFGSLWASTQLGAISDRYGRKPVTLSFLIGYPVLIISFYNASGWWLAILWPTLQLFALGTAINMGTYGTEMFPTSYRSTSAGAQAAFSNTGTVLALATQSGIYALVGSHWTAISLLAGLILLTPAIVWFAFPETSGRNLEDIAPEREYVIQPKHDFHDSSANVHITPH